MDKNDIEKLMNGQSEHEKEHEDEHSMFMRKERSDMSAQEPHREYSVRDQIMADQRKKAEDRERTVLLTDGEQSKNDTADTNNSAASEDDVPQSSSSANSRSGYIRSLAAGAAALIVIFGIGMLVMGGKSSDSSKKDSKQSAETSAEDNTEPTDEPLDRNDSKAKRLYDILNSYLDLKLPHEIAESVVEDETDFNYRDLLPLGDLGGLELTAMDDDNVYFMKQNYTDHVESSDLYKYVMETGKYELISKDVAPDSRALCISGGRIYFAVWEDSDKIYSIDLGDGSYKEVFRSEPDDRTYEFGINECGPCGDSGGILLVLSDGTEKFIKKIDKDGKVSDLLSVSNDSPGSRTSFALNGDMIYQLTVLEESKTAVMTACDSSGEVVWSKELSEFCPELAELTGNMGENTEEDEYYTLESGWFDAFGDHFLFIISDRYGTYNVLFNSATGEVSAADIISHQLIPCAGGEKTSLLVIGNEDDYDDHSLYAVDEFFRKVSYGLTTGSAVTNGTQLAYFDFNNDLNIITY